MESDTRVAIVMGSDSDLPVVEKTVKMLEQFDVPFELRVMSAHRSPEAVEEFSAEAEERGVEVIIAAAGGAAHLAGVLASRTVLPVIGLPVPTDRMGGMDSLFSTLQMPSGVPVACVGLGSSGARNAAVLAVQILAAADPEMREALRSYKSNQADGVSEQNANIQEWLRDRI